jgi:hypothetical protein
LQVSIPSPMPPFSRCLIGPLNLPIPPPIMLFKLWISEWDLWKKLSLVS